MNIIFKKLYCVLLLVFLVTPVLSFAADGIDFNARPTTVVHSDFTGDGLKDIYVYHKNVNHFQFVNNILVIKPVQKEEGKLFYRAHDSSQSISISFDDNNAMLNHWRSRTSAIEQENSFANPDLRDGTVKSAFVDFAGRVHASQYQTVNQQHSVTTGDDVVVDTLTELPIVGPAIAITKTIVDYYNDKHLRDTLEEQEWGWLSDYKGAYVNAMNDIKGVTDIKGANVGNDIPAAAKSDKPYFNGQVEDTKALRDYLDKIEEFIVELVNDAYISGKYPPPGLAKRARNLAHSYMGYHYYKTDEESNLANQQGRDISPTPQGCTGCGTNQGFAPDSDATDGDSLSGNSASHHNLDGSNGSDNYDGNNDVSPTSGTCAGCGTGPGGFSPDSDAVGEDPDHDSGGDSDHGNQGTENGHQGGSE